MTNQMISRLRAIFILMGLAVIFCGGASLIAVGPIITVPALISILSGAYLFFCSFNVGRVIE